MVTFASGAMLAADDLKGVVVTFTALVAMTTLELGSELDVVDEFEPSGDSVDVLLVYVALLKMADGIGTDETDDILGRTVVAATIVAFEIDVLLTSDMLDAEVCRSPVT